MRHGMEAGADDYLTKPFTAQEVIRALFATLRKREIVKKAIRQETDTDVFVSYSRNDRGVMVRVRDLLLTNALRVWTDEYLEVGTPDWDREIVNVMKYTGCCVVLLSPDAEKSKWVGREIALAEILNIRMFPVLVRGDERNAIPLRLVSNQWLDARHNSSEALQQLVESIRRYLSRGR